MLMRPRERGDQQAAQHRDRRRTGHSLRSDPDCLPPRFWDNLSYIPLCKSALCELDRRNDTNNPRERSSEALRLSLRRFSRTGGPDLSDLRGCPHLTSPKYTNSRALSMPSSEYQGRHPSRSDMPGRGRFSISVRARGRGRGRSRGASRRPRGGGMTRESVAAAQNSSTTSNTSKTAPHHSGFQQHLFDYNILPLVHFWPDGERPSPPDNMVEIETYLSTARTSEPAESFQRFQSLYGEVKGGDDAVNLLDTLQGDRLDLAQTQGILQKKQLSNLKPLTDGSIPSGSPDRVYGARSNELEKDIREELEGMIVPTSEKDFICPNFVIHVKSDKGDVGAARVQAAYNGALVARGMQSLWNFGNQPDSSPEVQRQGCDRGSSIGDVGAPLDMSLATPQVARTITCTWADGVLTMYATHCEDTRSDPAPEFPRYVPSLVGSWVMTAKENQFREGLAAYRNGMDWAKAQREEVISRANERVRAEKANG